MDFTLIFLWVFGFRFLWGRVGWVVAVVMGCCRGGEVGCCHGGEVGC